MSAALDVSGLSVTLGGRQVVTDVSFSLAAGQLGVLLGANGAGKTTTLRAILGLVPRARGNVHVDGGPVRVGRTTHIGYVPQRHEFAWDYPISVFDAVVNARVRMMGWGRLARRRDYDAALTALTKVGLVDLRDRPVGQLSGGQRQRVLLARALSLQPQVLLLDEPLTGLDLPASETLTTLFTDLAAAGETLLMTTHDLAQAYRTSSKILLLKDTIVADGPPQEVSDPALWARTFGVKPSSPLLDFLHTGSTTSPLVSTTS